MSSTGLWVYLAATPLFWLTATLVAWIVSIALARASGRNPLVNPVLLSIMILGCILRLSGTKYQTYFNGAQFIHFLLGPATVALGVPLYRNLKLVRENLVPMLVSLVIGSVAAIASAAVIATLLGVPHTVVVSLAPKSVTAGVAMALSQSLGGIPSLTAALVIFTGIVGAILVTPLMNALKIKDYAARGFAAGLAAHGIGTARAFAVDPVAGTFAGIAMGLNAVLTAAILPVVLSLLPQ